MKSFTLVAALSGASLFNTAVFAQTAQPIPAWDHQIVSAARFVVLPDFANAAVHAWCVRAPSTDNLH